jgi:hypothetical protein
MNTFLTALAIVMIAGIALPLIGVGIRILIAGLFDEEYSWMDAIFGLTLIVTNSLAGGVLFLLLIKKP